MFQSVVAMDILATAALKRRLAESAHSYFYRQDPAPDPSLTKVTFIDRAQPPNPSLLVPFLRYKVMLCFTSGATLIGSAPRSTTVSCSI